MPTFSKKALIRRFKDRYLELLGLSYLGVERLTVGLELIARVALGRTMSRTTVANAGTVTVAGIRGGVLYQDASGGNVTMTMAAAAGIDAEFTGLVTGDSLDLHMASNHAANTSTLSGGTGNTYVGSGAVTQTGGSFKLIKTGTATYDIVRVG